MARKAITTIPPAPQPEEELTRAKTLAPDNVISFTQKIGRLVADKIAEEDQTDAGVKANFVETDVTKVEMTLNSELDLDPVGDEDESESDHGAELIYDENGNPVSVTGYLPGLTPHPADVAPTIHVIGAGITSEINAVARREMIEEAEKRGYPRVLQTVLKFHPDGLVPESDDCSDMHERRKLAARFLMNSLNIFEESGVDPTDEELFEVVTEALLALFRSKWKLHITDLAVDTITRTLVDEDTTEDDLIASMILLGFSTEQWHFEALHKVMEFANEYGDEALRKGRGTDVGAMKFADGVESIYVNGDELNISFDLFLYALQQSCSWDEMKYFVAILKKQFEGFDSDKSIVTEKIRMNKFKVRLLNTLLDLKEKDPESFIENLGIVFKKETVNEAARKAIALLNKAGK